MKEQTLGNILGRLEQPTQREKYNDYVRKCNKYDNIFEEATENDFISDDDIKYMKNHYKVLKDSK